ncbi:ferritin-like domain-containing protein [Humisphaera borealis]|uniref:Ferritin-like domain-containing protein n=1 Tax=Humisphaera borealis TaxID=2807512 RepID=A0A7M2WZP1_9BACT|nr:ferritin-like domain-containing protein [Humisphaera borealis]QOV90321.1 ferritin-like domain-containing protein [Humisphaera borealis]
MFNRLSIVPASTSSRFSTPRRRFLQQALGGIGIAGLAHLGFMPNAALAVDPTTEGLRKQPSAKRDQDILNFALNLEYLEAEFYLRAATGQGLTVADDISGEGGTPGEVTGGRAVNFDTAAIRDYANEIAADELAHVRLLRSALKKPVPRVAIDLSASFTAAARAAGLVGPTEEFDAFANESNFLLAAYIFEDVGVTAYKGAAPLLRSNAILEVAAGLLAVEAYHAGLIRGVLFSKGLGTQANAISDLRDAVDGDADLDQGILNTDSTANIVPTDANGLTFSRTPGQVLNIVYLNSAGTPGGFFPAGIAGKIQ